MPGITPVFMSKPQAKFKWGRASSVGEHNDAIYEGLLGFSQSVCAELHAERVI